MRSSLFSKVLSLGVRAIKPLPQQTARTICILRPCCSNLPCLPYSALVAVRQCKMAVVPTTAQARNLHLDLALCKKKKERRRRKFPKRGCGEKKRRRKRRCVVTHKRVCLKDLDKEVCKKRKMNPPCCPCKKPKMMDIYRKQ